MIDDNNEMEFALATESGDTITGQRILANERVRELVDALEEQIVLGWLMPRERLLEEQLTKTFSCKKHIVREALSELERMGLVERVPNKGATVRLLSAEEVRQIYAVRETLEALAATEIPMPASAELLSELEDIQKRHTSAVESGDSRSAFRANMRFHETLFGACGNPYLVEIILSAAQKVHGARFFTATSKPHLSRACEEHWAMIRALQTGDRRGLIQLCHDHIGPSRDAYLLAIRDRVTAARVERDS